MDSLFIKTTVNQCDTTELFCFRLIRIAVNEIGSKPVQQKSRITGLSHSMYHLFRRH